jgi:hypothetical protein
LSQRSIVRETLEILIVIGALVAIAMVAVTSGH